MPQSQIWYLFVDGRGVIGLTRDVPHGMLVIADGPDADLLQSVAEVLARHAYDGKTLLVPGVPEAEDGESAVDAVLAFQAEFRKRLAVRQ